MSDSHGEKHKKGGHCHIGVYREKDRKWLGWAMAVTGLTMFIEFIGSFFTGSLALFSDASHMLTHFLALAISFGAIWIASRPASHQKTFGYYRAEILATLVNGLILLAITVYIIYEAYERFISPRPIKELSLLAIAFFGLVVNLISAYFLNKTDKKCLNLRGAFIHMLSDTLSSVAIIFGAIVMHFTGFTIIDPILAVAISILILIWSYRLFEGAIHILFESTPKGMSVAEIELTLKEHIPEVKDIHDIHVWEITSGMYALTSHAVVGDINLNETKPILRKIKEILEERFNIKHTNIQFCLDKKCEKDEETENKPR